MDYDEGQGSRRAISGKHDATNEGCKDVQFVLVGPKRGKSLLM